MPRGRGRWVEGAVQVSPSVADWGAGSWAGDPEAEEAPGSLRDRDLHGDERGVVAVADGAQRREWLP